MPKAVRFHHYGGIDVLQVVDVERPAPGPGQVLVHVKAAGINPGEASIRKGLLADRWPATFPSGQGSTSSHCSEKAMFSGALMTRARAPHARMLSILV